MALHWQPSTFNGALQPVDPQAGHAADQPTADPLNLIQQPVHLATPPEGQEHATAVKAVGGAFFVTCACGAVRETSSATQVWCAMEEEALARAVAIGRVERESAAKLRHLRYLSSLDRTLLISLERRV